MIPQEKYLEDLERGEKDRESDIKIYGEQYVNHYKFKCADGWRYNVIMPDEMFDSLKKQAISRGLK